MAATSLVQREDTVGQGGGAGTAGGALDTTVAATNTKIATVAGVPTGATGSATTTAVQLASLPCVRGFYISNDDAAVNIYLGIATVTSAGANRFVQIPAGQRYWISADNSNRFWVVSASATPAYSILAE